MSTAGEPFSITVENRRASLITAAEVFDSKNFDGFRRGIQLLGATFVLLLFVRNVFQQPGDWVSWLCLVASVGFACFVWKFPRISNARFAEVKLRHAPKVTFTFGEEDFTVDEQPGVYQVNYQENRLQIWEFQQIFVISFGKGNLAAIEQEQLSPEQTAELREIFQSRMPNRFELVDTIKKMI